MNYLMDPRVRDAGSHGDLAERRASLSGCEDRGAPLLLASGAPLGSTSYAGKVWHGLGLFRERAFNADFGNGCALKADPERIHDVALDFRGGSLVAGMRGDIQVYEDRAGHGGLLSLVDDDRDREIVLLEQRIRGSLRLSESGRTGLVGALLADDADQLLSGECLCDLHALSIVSANGFVKQVAA